MQDPSFAQRIRRLIAGVLAGTLVGVSSLQAQELYEYNQNLRAAGMGGVRVLSDWDPTMMYWNPAALAYIRGFRWSLLSIGAAVNNVDNFDSLRATQINTLSDLNNLYGTDVYLRAQGNSTVAIPNFGFGIAMQRAAGLVLNNPANPTLNMNYLSDMTYTGGMAFFLPGDFAVGANVKRIARTGGSQAIGVSTLPNVANPDFFTNLENSFTAKGSGWGVDLGMMYTPDYFFNPTFSLSWIDAGFTTFTPDNPLLPTPDSNRDNLVANLSIQNSFLGFGYTAGLEFRHLLTQPAQFGKKAHMGVELNLPIVDLRAGVSQGYSSFGVGVDLFMMQVDAALYTVERGVYPGQDGDKRIEVSVRFNLGFDPTFGMGSTGRGGARAGAAGAAGGGSGSDGSRARNFNQKQRR